MSETLRAALAVATVTCIVPMAAQAGHVGQPDSTSCADAQVYAVLTDSSHLAFSACLGPVAGSLTANPTNVAALESLIESHWALTLGFQGLSNQSAGGPFAADPGTPSGELVLDDTWYGPLVLGLQGPSLGAGGGGQYTLYEFRIAEDLGVTELHFDMAGTAVKNGNVHKLSHAALYTTTIASPQPRPRVLAVPEPGSLALSFGALAGLAAVARARRR